VPYPGFTGPVSQALRPFPQYSDISSVAQENGRANYNSLQIRIQKYYQNGASFLIAYTGSKLMTNAYYQFASFNAWATDTYNRKLEWALSLDNTPQNLVMSGTYELPFGPGKHFVNVHGPVGKMVGGWTISGICQYISGTPIGIGGGQPIPNYGGTTRPDLLAATNIIPYSSWNGRFYPSVDKYLNAAAWTQPAPYTYGTSPIYLPRARTWDSDNESFGLIKHTQWGSSEVKNVEFRAEFFNAFNRTTWCGPDGNVNDVVGFGSVGCQSNSPRIIQLALKFNW